MIATNMHTQCYAVTGVLLLSIPVWTFGSDPAGTQPANRSSDEPRRERKSAFALRTRQGHRMSRQLSAVVGGGRNLPSRSFRWWPVLITLRFSDGASDLTVADNSPDAAPRGMAIRFEVGHGTDIMAISHNGFVVGTGEDFLELQRAILATDHSQPHPWPIEVFLVRHPRALKFVQDLAPVPASFVAESYYSNNALVFVNTNGQRQVGRYQIVPVSGSQNLDDASAKAAPHDFLFDELRQRLTRGPARFHLLLQLADPGDQTNDGSIVWPDDHRTVELGVITVSSIVPDSAMQKARLPSIQHGSLTGSSYRMIRYPHCAPASTPTPWPDEAVNSCTTASYRRASR